MAYTTINKSTDHFNTVLYAGNSSTQAITGVGFAPDWVWLKERTQASDHCLFDAVRGANKDINSNDTSAEATSSNKLTAFGSDGFTLGNSNTTNQSGQNNVSWNWKAGGGQGSANTDGSINTTYTSANTTAGFSISKYTGTGANATIGHGLGVAPNVIITKQLTGSTQWNFQNSMVGYSQYMALSDNAASQATGGALISSASNTIYSCNGNSAINAGGGSTYVAYCFAEKTGYSKFGSYTGNGNVNGTFVYTGFKPAFVITKKSSGADEWNINDTTRNPFNPLDKNLLANTSAAESDFDRFDALSNGFKMRTDSGQYNGSGATYIYMAFGQSLVGTNNVPCTAR